MTRAEIIGRHPIVEFLTKRGHKLIASGENFVTNSCPDRQHKHGHQPVTIDVAKQVFHCNDCDVGGSVIDWIKHEKNVTTAEAMRELGGGRNDEKSRGKFVCAYDYTDERGKLLFQVVRLNPKDFYQRHPNGRGDWINNMRGVRRVLYHLPQVIAAERVIVVEGEKDAENLTKLGFTATTNVGGAEKWRDEYSEMLRGKDVIIIGDNDDDGRVHVAKLIRSLSGIARSLKHAPVPDKFKDVSGFIGLKLPKMALQAINKLIGDAPELPPARSIPDLHAGPGDSAETNAPQARRAPLTIRTVDEILAMTFDDADLILKNGYLQRGDPCAVCGMGGVGKSRLAMQLACCCRTGGDFLGWPTNGRNLRFLFLQTENSCRRLKADLERMLSAFTPEEQKHIKAGLFFHTLECDDDGFLMLDAENLERVADAITRTKANVVVYDPLRDFSLDDLNSDKFMGDTLRQITRVTKRGNPKRTALVIHHAATGKAGVQKTTWFDRSSFGRNSKVLFAWTRAQINVAPAKGEDNRVIIVASGKCNDAPEFEPFAARLNFKTMLYARDDDFDVGQWHQRLAGTAARRTYDPEIVRDLIWPTGANKERKHLQKKALAKLVMDASACSRTTAYEVIDRAQKKGFVRFSKISQSYEKLDTERAALMRGLRDARPPSVR